MPYQVDPELRPYIFLLALAKVLRGPSLEEIRIYFKDRPSAPIAEFEVLLEELVEMGALRKEGSRYLITVGGESFVRSEMPDPLQTWRHVRQTLSAFLEIGGATMEELAKHFGSGQPDALFRELIHRFVDQGTLDLRRDGRYYVSDEAKFRYKLDEPN